MTGSAYQRWTLLLTLFLILLNKGRGLGRGGDPLDSVGGPADLFSMFFRVFFSRWFLEGVLECSFVAFVVLGVPGEVTFGVFLRTVLDDGKRLPAMDVA